MNTQVHDWKQEFHLLKSHAEALLGANPDTQQVIVLRTVNGNLYSVVNRCIFDGDYREEDACLRQLREENDTQVLSILAMGDAHWPEVTSTHFNLGLVALNPENEDARIFLQGRDCIMCKRLKVVLPPRSERPELQQEFFALRCEAEEIRKANPGAEKIIVLRTHKNALHAIVIPSDAPEGHQTENACLEALSNSDDTAVYSVLTLMKNGATDFAPSDFLQALHQLNPANKRANIFRQVFVSELEDVLPPIFTPEAD